MQLENCRLNDFNGPFANRAIGPAIRLAQAKADDISCRSTNKFVGK